MLEGRANSENAQHVAGGKSSGSLILLGSERSDEPAKQALDIFNLIHGNKVGRLRAEPIRKTGQKDIKKPRIIVVAATPRGFRLR